MRLWKPIFDDEPEFGYVFTGLGVVVFVGAWALFLVWVGTR
jgi:hypothetical protein